MGKKNKRFNLTDKQEVDLVKIANGQKSEVRLVFRATIILILA
ncbi:hypothetical protein [Desulfofarcimen acetoxidans]|nr:hypothetical protein [Desulfofarcimen acetoxidans]